MTRSQRQVVMFFGPVIGLVLAWGLGTFGYYCYLDAKAPPGALSEWGFAEGLPVLILALLISGFLAIILGIAFYGYRKNPKDV
jgi:hypothetical protein